MSSLVVCATLCELEPFFARHSLKEESFPQPGTRLFSADSKQTKFDILITGPGIFNCAFALARYMAKKIPPRIFQTGIAGVFSESGLGPGDVAVADQIQYLHTGVSRSEKQPTPLPFALIPDHPDTCWGRYPCDERLASFCLETLQKKRQELTKERFQLVQGKILTVSQITGDMAQKMDIPGKEPPVMEAMEGAAAAHGAALYGIPLVEIRAGSNMAGERDKSRWNIPLAAERISWVLDCLMDMESTNTGHWE